MILSGYVAPNEGGVDTSDATAAETDIAKDKTAYINGKKVSGQLVDYRGANKGTPIYSANVSFGTLGDNM